MLKERFTVKPVGHMHEHGSDLAWGPGGPGITMSYSTETEAEAMELGREKCKAGEWYAFQISKFYYWEE